MAKMANKQPFRFLDLPSELRCLVYRQLLKGNCALNIKMASSNKCTGGRSCSTMHRGRAHAVISSDCNADISTHILFVCKQVYFEAVPILYSENAFMGASPQIVTFFVKGIGSSIQHLRHTGFSDTTSPVKTSFETMIQALKPATKLTTLEMSQVVFAPGLPFTHRFATPTELFDQLIPLVRALSGLRRKNMEIMTTASEIISIRFTYKHDPSWEGCYFEADKIETKVNAMLAETMI